MKKGYYLIGAVALLISFYLDKYILDLFSKIRFEALTNFMAYFTITGSGFCVLILITILLSIKKENYLLNSWSALGFSLFVTWIIKILIMRARPEMGLIAETGFSFPSGHATAVFSVYPFLRKYFKKMSSYWLVFAVLIGISRLYLGVHYLSDVVAGALVGLIVGSFIIKTNYFKFLKRR